MHREVVVFSTQELPLADIAGAILEEAGIPFLRRTRGGALVAAGAAHLAPVPGEEHRIAVAEEDVEAAGEALAAIGEPLPLEALDGSPPSALEGQPAPPNTPRDRSGAVVLLLAAAVLALAVVYVLQSW